MIVKIEKLVFGGQGLGRVKSGSSADHAAGKACFVWNGLPGEEVEVEIRKNKENFAEGIAKKILKKSSDRLEPQEEHYLSCSPWQIMSFEAENEWKVEIAKETYEKLGNLRSVSKDYKIKKLKIASDGKEYGYRNKMEYSFGEADGRISLAFFEREGKKHLAIEKCGLARPEINEAALDLLDWVNKNGIPIRSLKTMIVRCSQKGEVLAGLFIKDRLEFDNYPELKSNLVGLTVFYSTHKSPASVRTDILYKAGQDYLEEDLFEVKLRYGLFSFFQINVPVFEKAMEDIKKFTDSADNVIDYYSGVGSIGLVLSKNIKTLELVENNFEAVKFAIQNINLNNLNVHCQSAEKMLELITAGKTVIFDPPRAGLDKRAAEKILKESPRKIIYLSCNLATQARDIGLLKEKYDIKFLKLYNFFPRTAHIEGLCVLERSL